VSELKRFCYTVLFAVQGVAVLTWRTLSGNVQCLWNGIRYQVCLMVIN